MEKLDVVALLSAAQQIERNVSIALMYSGLRLSQFRLLDWLAGREPATVTEVSRTLNITRASASVMVNELIAKGVLLAEENPADRRSSLLFLSDLGRSKLSVARSDLSVLRDKMSARHTAETIRLLNAFASHLTAEHVSTAKTSGQD